MTHPPMDELYSGNSFSVSASPGRRCWSIWALADDASGKREQLTLGRDGMDELRVYFADYYPVDTENAGVTA